MEKCINTSGESSKGAGALARTSSILGAISLPLFFTILGLIIAILAIVLSILGSKIDNSPNKLKRRCLKTGLILGIIVIVLHFGFGLMAAVTDARLSRNDVLSSSEAVLHVAQQPKTGNTKTSPDYIPTTAERTNTGIKENSENGNAEAYVKLGWSYYAGQGVPQNYAEATKCYLKAAEMGHAAAQCMLGLMYAKGEGVTQDESEAVKWYTRSARQGYATAMSMLGEIYYNCNMNICMKEDYVEAYKWYYLADLNGKGEPKAINTLRNLMTSEQIAEAQRRAREFIER